MAINKVGMKQFTITDKKQEPPKVVKGVYLPVEDIIVIDNYVIKTNKEYSVLRYKNRQTGKESVDSNPKARWIPSQLLATFINNKKTVKKPEVQANKTTVLQGDLEDYKQFTKFRKAVESFYKGDLNWKQVLVAHTGDYILRELDKDYKEIILADDTLAEAVEYLKSKSEETIIEVSINGTVFDYDTLINTVSDNATVNEVKRLKRLLVQYNEELEALGRLPKPTEKAIRKMEALESLIEATEQSIELLIK